METAIQVFEESTAFTSGEELLRALAEPVEFWKSQSKDNYTKDKKMSRIYIAANRNLALIAFASDQFDLAKEYADRVLAVDPKDKTCKRLLEWQNALLKRMEPHNLFTLHYKRDLENAVAPSEVAALEEHVEELQDENDATDAIAVVNGQEVKGQIYLEKGAEDFIFGDNGNVKFLVTGTTEIDEYDLVHEDVESFTIEGRAFTKEMFRPRAKGESESKISILEHVYSSDRITLYKYYPTGSKLGESKHEFALRRKGEEEIVSLLDTQFLLFDKGMAKYFSDCEDLASMCAEGEFEMNRDDLVKAVRIYSELCDVDTGEGN